MKKHFVYLSLLCILVCSGCKNAKKEVEKPIIDLSCQIVNHEYRCDNYILEYNENHDLTLIKSVSDGTSFQYSYELGKLVSFSENDKVKYQVSYKDDMVDTITSFKEDKIEYHFTYDEKHRLKEISKTFNDLIVDEKITYDYLYENGETYVIETKNVSGYQTVSKFLSKYFVRPQTAFELVNDFPSIYYEILESYPYSDFKHVNNSILYIPRLQTSYTVRLNGEETNKLEFYYDESGRYIKDSLELTIHSYDDKNENEFTRTTIYQKELGDYTTTTYYYQYQTDYKLKDGEIVEFIKYHEKEISKDEFEKLKREYLKKNK